MGSPAPRVRRSGSRVRSTEKNGRSGPSKGGDIKTSSSSKRSRSRGVEKRRVSFTDLQVYSGGAATSNDGEKAVESEGEQRSSSSGGTGDGMTIWWIVLTFVTLFFRFEATIRQEYLKMDVNATYLETALDWLITTSKGDNPSEVALGLLRGVSAVSGICVGGGYYTFKILYRMTNGSMSRHLYEAHDVGRHCSYSVFLMMDILIHVGFVALIAYYWARHITPAAALISFVFHRLWSWTFSTGRQLFYTRVDKVYGFNRMPTWSFFFLYGSEFIIISTSIFATS